MASNISIAISADASQLRAGAAVAVSEMRALQREVNGLANAFRKSGDDIVGAKLAQAASQLAAVKIQAADLTKQAESMGSALKLNRAGMMELQASGINAFQALASGMDVFRVAMMEGSQVLGGLVQGGVIGFGGMTAALAALAAGSAAAAAGVGYIAFQAIQSSQQIREISTSLAILGENVPTKQIEEWASALRGAFNLGVSESNEVVKAFANVGKLTLEQRQRLSELAVAFAQANGQDPAKVAAEWAKIASSGSKGLMQLADKFKISTLEAKKFIDAGNEPAAVVRLIDDLSARIERQVGLWARLKGAFDEFIKSGAALGTEGTPGPAGVAPPSPTQAPGPQGTRRVPRIASNVDYADLTDDIRSRFEQMLAAMPEELASSVRVISGFRTFDQQAEIRRRHEAMPGGVAAHPAASPGHSRHESGNALDFSAGPEADAWMRAHMAEFGLGTPVRNDPNHIQIVGGDLGRQAQQGENEARDKALRDARASYDEQAVAHRNALARQTQDAVEYHKKIKDLAGEGSADEVAAKQQAIQKVAAYYDQETQLQLQSLREQQANATDFADKIRIQRQIIGTLEGRGDGPYGGGGANPIELAQARTELAGLRRQQIQQNFQLAEQGASAMRAANADIFRGFQAQQTESVRERNLAPLQALDVELAKSKELATENAAELYKLYAAATANTDRIKIYWELWHEGVRAAAEQQQLLSQRAQEVKSIVDKWVQPVKEAFDQIGSSIESSISGLLTGKKTWGDALKDIGDQAISSVVSGAGSIMSKLAARSLFGAQNGEGIGDALFNSISKSIGIGDLLGVGGQTANTTALTANTAALVANAAALGGSAAASAAGGAASLAGGAATSAGAAAAGGGIFSWLGGLLAFSRGGIVPSAAGGWALPSFAGAQPALLHSKEMVLPAHISDGLQKAFGGGALSGDMHLHMHGLAFDGPSVDRMLRSRKDLVADMFRDAFRGGRLTPRTI